MGTTRRAKRPTKKTSRTAAGAEGRKRAPGKPGRANARAGAGQRLPEIQAQKKAVFLEAFRAMGTILHASRAAEVGRATVYDWLRDDAEFKASFDQARDDFVDTLEKEAYRRAVEGVEEPVFGRIDKDLDGEVGRIRKYSDKLMEVLLRGNRQEKYNRRQMEHTGKDGQPLIPVDPAKLTDEQLRQLAELVRALSDGGESK